MLSIAACSNDDSEIVPAEQPFSKIIIYKPSLANFTTKEIQYYNAANDIISDTIFNATGDLTQRIVRTLNGNIKTIQRFNSQNAITNTATEEYDSNGRLINLDNNNITFTYNSDNTITASSASVGGAFFIFSKNANGIINNRLEISDNSNVSLNFQNQLPTEYLNDGTITGNFTYYPNPIPANLLQSVNQMNNTILRFYRLEHLPSVCNAYLNNWFGISRYEREFNSQNYQTYSKGISINGTAETITSESFYFYY